MEGHPDPVTVLHTGVRCQAMLNMDVKNLAITYKCQASTMLNMDAKEPASKCKQVTRFHCEMNRRGM